MTDGAVKGDFWQGRRVFLTGHTGFKGGWLALWLHGLGARTTGFALEPPTLPSLFRMAGVDAVLEDRRGDIRDPAAVAAAMRAAAPEIVFHLAAQPLVRLSYQEPVATFATNVMGTAHLLEAVRQTPSVRAVVIVTSDKCYENREWVWGYRENDPMGGHDPYSASKGCTELLTAAWQRSFFPVARLAEHRVAVASVRAGNVIGGGDWAADRLVPDAMRAFLAGETVRIRNPQAVRPWQHVLEPLSGYLAVAEALCGPEAADFAQSWNFGPGPEAEQTVGTVVSRLGALWGDGAVWSLDDGPHPHEAGWLALDSAKARRLLGWTPRWSLDQALEATVAWYRASRDGIGRSDETMAALTRAQIAAYARSALPSPPPAS